MNARFTVKPSSVLGTILLAIVVLLGRFESAAFAHPESLSGLRVTMRDTCTRATLSLPIRELSKWFPPEKYPAYADQVAAELSRVDLLQIQYGESTPPQVTHVSAKPVEAAIVIELDFPALPATEHALAVWSTALGNLPNDHRQFLSVEDERRGVNRLVAQETLTVLQDAWAGTLPDVPATAPSTAPQRTISPAERATAQSQARSGGEHERVTSFFILGIEHILTGYDHLLFLAALLLVCDRFADAAKIITVFTVAHSVTLALAALDIVRLPGRVVEPLIAASIVYVAFENIVLRSKAPQWRRAIVFAFGLIHGLGFASVLREVGLGSSGVGVAGPLLKFNLGVEVGQLAVASILLPLIFALKRRPQFIARGVPATSVVIAAVGAFWLVTRVLGGD